MYRRTWIWEFAVVAIAATGCSLPAPIDPELLGSEAYRIMTLDERIAVHTEILEAKAKAKKDAAEKYPPFKSQESALDNTEYRNGLTEEALAAIEAKYGLDRQDFKLLEAHYLRSRGARLRE